jgi:hypothetical protein
MATLPTDLLSVSEFASLFGFPASVVAEVVEAQRQRRSDNQAYFSVSQLADRWTCSRAQVYAVLRASAAKVLDIGEGKKRKKILVSAEVVARIEKARIERMS